MRLRLILAGVPPVALLLCALATLWHVAHVCVATPVWCSVAARVCDLLVMLGPAGLPLLVWAGLGAQAGLRTWGQTRRVARSWTRQPRIRPPAAVRAMLAELGLTDRVELVVAATPTAFCYGFWRPRIVLSTGLVALLTAEELRAVLLHERAHLRRRDPLRLWLWSMLDAACWWTAGGLSEARLRCELLADRAVLRAGAQAALAGALLKLLDRPQALPAPGAISGLSATAARIDHLLAPEQPLPRRRAWRWVGPPLALSIAALTCGLLMLARA